MLGFTVPLASAMIHSVSLLDMVVWSAVALGVQVAVFTAADRLMRGVSALIEKDNVAAGVTLGSGSLTIGLINAASMSY